MECWIRCGLRTALPNSLVDILDREEKKRGGGKRGRTSFTLPISVKAMVNDDLIV